MEVILKEDYTGLGYKNDVVKVKPGFARNYLIPRGIAILATEGNKKMLAENLKQAAHKAEKIKNEAISLAERIGELMLEIPAKVGESGKIFGSVTTTQIADALKKKGFEIDRKKIAIVGEAKTIGEYKAVLDLHREVKHTIVFKVVAE
ncbi:50S ribosomal protein L9 [Raineya orbicola]|jgi:large subunit ribosomal protein L9|uniref:Large ribosomal subunit protein bL9 n=1 Tax=Raineya orbicola TaxID=2016530 RepID=A0A2N3IHS2_9BACT|nr:50S ribosomal protein L9 [Raineya orbicola]PKQ69910.1 L9: ribosomal protein L9 [Raineya orbicola]